MEIVLLKIILSLPLAGLAVITFLNEAFSKIYSYPNKYIGLPLPMRHYFYQAVEKTYKDELLFGNIVLNFFLWVAVFFLLFSFLEILKKFKRAFLISRVSHFCHSAPDAESIQISKGSIL